MFVVRLEVQGMGFGRPLKWWWNPSRWGLGLERNDAGRRLAVGFLLVRAMVRGRTRARRKQRIAIGHGYKPALAGRMSLFVE